MKNIFTSIEDIDNNETIAIKMKYMDIVYHICYDNIQYKISNKNNTEIHYKSGKDYLVECITNFVNKEVNTKLTNFKNILYNVDNSLLTVSTIPYFRVPLESSQLFVTTALLNAFIYISDEWIKYKLRLKHLNKICFHLNKYLKRIYNTDIVTHCKQLWYTIVITPYYNEFIDAIIQFSFLDRNKFIIPHVQIKNTIEMFHDITIIKTDNDVQEEHNLFDVYKTIFLKTLETRYLIDCSKEFISSLYIQYISVLIDSELHFIQVYLPAKYRKDVLNLIKDVYVRQRETVILKILYEQLYTENFTHLDILARIISDVIPSEKLYCILKQVIQKDCMEYFQPTMKCVQFIINCAYLRNKYMRIVQLFNVSYEFSLTIFKEYLATDIKYAKLGVDYILLLMAMNSNSWETNYINGLTLLPEDKLFNEYLHKYALHLLHLTPNTEIATKMNNILKTIFICEHNVKLQAMLKDMKMSLTINKNWNNNIKDMDLINNTFLETSIQILPNGTNWPLLQYPITCKLPNNMCYLIKQFESFFRESKSKTKINWLWHYSKCEIITTCFPRKYHLFMNFLQMSVLTQFNDKFEYTIEELINLTSISFFIITQIIDVFVKHKILIAYLTTPTLSLQTKIALNLQFTQIMSKINLISQFKYEEPRIIAHNSTSAVHTTALDYKSHISAAIVSILKKKKQLTASNLFKEVTNLLIGRINIYENDIKNTINFLIYNKFIKEENQVYFYIP